MNETCKNMFSDSSSDFVLLVRDPDCVQTKFIPPG